MRGKAILEQIFDGETARVLDHLANTRPFDFSISELNYILEISPEKLHRIIKHLVDYELVISNGESKYQFAENDRTKVLNQFLYQVMLWNLDNATKEGN